MVRRTGGRLAVSGFLRNYLGMGNQGQTMDLKENGTRRTKPKQANAGVNGARPTKPKQANADPKEAGPIKSKKKQNKLLYIILLVIFAAILIVVSIIMLRDKHVERTAEEIYQDLGSGGGSTGGSEPDYVESEDPELSASGIKVPDKEPDWNLMKETNGDIYAWIYIPGTSVDYPVVQHPDDNGYYLDHNLDGSDGYPGCIFTENYNTKDFKDKNTVIYGHDMNDGTMFDTLHDYEDEAFFNENRYIFIYLPDKVLVYDIFAAYESGAEHILTSHNFINDVRYQEYLDGVFQMRSMGAHFRDGAEVGVQDHIITLSTCIDLKPDSRYLVQGVLVNEAALGQ